MGSSTSILHPPRESNFEVPWILASQLKSISTMKFLVLACLFVVSALAEPEAEAEADSRYLGSLGSRIAGQSYYGRPGFYGNGAYNRAYNGAYNGAYKTYNNYAVYPQSYMSAYNTPYSGNNLYNQYRSQYNNLSQSQYNSAYQSQYNRFK